MTDDSKVWKGLKRVSAPSDFEDRILREVDLRRRIGFRERKAHLFKWALSGSAAVLLATFALLNLFVFRGGLAPIGNSPAVASAGDPIHVTERVDYGREVRAASEDLQTVYLLEQVSDVSSSLIRY